MRREEMRGDISPSGQTAERQALERRQRMPGIRRRNEAIEVLLSENWVLFWLLPAPTPGLQREEEKENQGQESAGGGAMSWVQDFPGI
jgi:hypothetical protein